MRVDTAVTALEAKRSASSAGRATSAASSRARATAVWLCLAGFEVNIPTITHTIGAHDGLVARAFLRNPSPLILKADEPAKCELAELLDC
eukprot:7313377-Prymnesium_polylepis.1